MITMNMEDCEFLISSATFCVNIHKYAAQLHLDASLVNTYKSDSYLLSDLLMHPHYDGPAFEFYVQRKIRNMRLIYNYLVFLCKCSNYYSQPIGRDLGIEKEEEYQYAFSVN
jgi:hypothetical protein